MSSLYVASLKDGAGRTAVCLGVGRALEAEGRQVAYLNMAAGASCKKDADTVKIGLRLGESPESMCPVSGSLDEESLKKAAGAVGKLTKDKRTVLVEGLALSEGEMAAKAVGTLKAKAMLVVRYEAGVKPDEVGQAAKSLGDDLVGLVFNAVPETKVEVLSDLVVRPLEKAGLRVLGVLPEVRALSCASVGELAEHIGGTILNSEDRAGDLVESFMAGALSADSALSYLTLKDNKAVVTRGDHADIQLAALNTSTRCLVLTGGIDPLPPVMRLAQERAVPIVRVEKDTVSTLEALESVMGKADDHLEQRAKRLGEIVRDRIDVSAIEQAL